MIMMGRNELGLPTGRLAPKIVEKAGRKAFPTISREKVHIHDNNSRPR